MTSVLQTTNFNIVSVVPWSITGVSELTDAPVMFQLCVFVCDILLLNYMLFYYPGSVFTVFSLYTYRVAQKKVSCWHSTTAYFFWATLYITSIYCTINNSNNTNIPKLKLQHIVSQQAAHRQWWSADFCMKFYTTVKQ